ncbi:uncharacterized protein LOC143179085 isoform X2 [Calliopsis andreniformis]|uniref:uncharacterized protein LOC143179085 isoform X2 n=1 Tax=Calliopsis andreniformis TaxID=337506 RepID=UPI003FCC4C76
MPKTKDPFSEDVSLLYPNKHSDRFNRFSEGYSEAPIIKGVVSQLRRWPSDLFYAFLASCFIIGSLVFLIFVTVVICLPPVIGNSLQAISFVEIEASPNVYFFKLENQNWSTREFCYIETAARRHPDLHVYLINLLKDEPARTDVNASTADGAKLRFKPNGTIANNHTSLNQTPEELLKERLVFANANIRIINMSIDKFFRGSKLSTIAKVLNDEVLEMAAKAQLLWSVPGVALRPNTYCVLDSMQRFLCKNKDECIPDKLATIELENDIQATGVPCQAFMGFIMQEISKSDFHEKYTLKDAVEKYCPRLYYCPEIRILDFKPQCSTDALDCPAVYSSTLTQENSNLENFVM